MNMLAVLLALSPVIVTFLLLVLRQTPAGAAGVIGYDALATYALLGIPAGLLLNPGQHPGGPSLPQADTPTDPDRWRWHGPPSSGGSRIG
jgi:hypothetical protein